MLLNTNKYAQEYTPHMRWYRVDSLVNLLVSPASRLEYIGKAYKLYHSRPEYMEEQKNWVYIFIG